MSLEAIPASDHTLMYLASAMILSAFCAIFGQHQSKPLSTMAVEILGVLGLGLGALLAPFPFNRYFLMGVFGYASYFLFKSHGGATLKTISLVQIVLAIFLVLGSVFTGHSFATLAGLFLAFTLVPLPPFHVPFAFLVGSDQGRFSGFWLVVFLSLGLAELRELSPFTSDDLSIFISLLALGSAVYSSFKCLGQRQPRLLITYATIAHTSLLWGLTTVFSSFFKWGIPYGLMIALAMNGLLVAYTFVQQRYGAHVIGTLPGLAFPMPRFGTVLVLLISLAMLLPIIPILTGLTTLATIEDQDISLIFILLIFSSVWMFGSWYFSHLLHQTAFGQARPDIRYIDLKIGEVCILTLLIVGASYSGLFF